MSKVVKLVPETRDDYHIDRVCNMLKEEILVETSRDPKDPTVRVCEEWVIANYECALWTLKYLRSKRK